MIYTLITFVILLTFTLEPKYLGKLKLLSLQNITSKPNVQTIRHGLLIAFLLWLVYYLFQSEIESLFGKGKESMTDVELETKVVKYRETVNLDLTNGVTKQPVPLLKILNADNKASTGEIKVQDRVMLVDAEDENKMLVMNKNRYLMMMDIAVPKESYNYNTFWIKPEVERIDEGNYTVKNGDKIAISGGGSKNKTSNCGWFGCRVLQPKTGRFSHGKSARNVPYVLIKAVENEEPMENEEPYLSPRPAPGTFGSGTLPVSQEDTILKTPAASGPSYETTHGSMINHPELTRGLTVDKVTPKPIYYEPGTVKYNGLGYVPSYSEMVYLNNYPFESKPEELHEGNPHGFCTNKSNILNKIEEKCNGLPTNVCSTTDCCILVGGTTCVEGNENGPKNKVIYSDTSIKNRDVYYYKGECYGNCK